MGGQDRSSAVPDDVVFASPAVGTAAIATDVSAGEAVPPTPVLVAERVSKRYFRAGRAQGRHFDAVADVSLTLRAGELVCLEGRSGSGKTTLLSILGGLLVPTSGRVTLAGESIYDLDDRSRSKLRNRCLGVVPQGVSALFALTVLENVTLPWHLGARAGDPDAAALSLLERLHVADLADALPAELSGGELRRMAVARALVSVPSVVLADEPTADLDDESTAAVLGLLRETADEGSAVLIVTHEHGVERYADRTLHMAAGSLGQDASRPDASAQV